MAKDITNIEPTTSVNTNIPKKTEYSPRSLADSYYTSYLVSYPVAAAK
jgi:hypothetical protein